MTSSGDIGVELNNNQPTYTTFDFLNKELDLLFVLIFLEAFKEGRGTLYLTGFFKGDYWDINDVKEEIFDTNDYHAISDMVLEQIIFIFEHLKLGSIDGVGVDSVDNALTSWIIGVSKMGPEAASAAHESLEWCVRQIVFLDDLRQEKIMRIAEQNPDALVELLNDPSVFFTKGESHFRKLQPLTVSIPVRWTPLSRQSLWIDKRGFVRLVGDDE